MRKITTSFSLTKEEIELLEDNINNSGYSKIEYFRRRMLDKDPIIESLSDLIYRQTQDIKGQIEFSFDDFSTKSKENLEIKTPETRTKIGG